MTPVMAELWKKALNFHGHACTGLAIGCRMTALATGELGLTGKARDEELVCVAETDACLVDAAQALLGCTLGKGNLLLRFTGKMAMSFYRRDSARGCRVIWNPAPGSAHGPAMRELILSEQADGYFTITPLSMPDIPNARSHASGICSRCGETSMERMLADYRGERLCLDCHPEKSAVILTLP